MPVDQHCRQGEIEIILPLQPDFLQGAQRIDHLGRADRQARAPQHAGEIHHVIRQPARIRRADGSAHRAAEVSAPTLSVSSATVASPKRAMSSWYLSTTPSVAWTTSGSR